MSCGCGVFLLKQVSHVLPLPGNLDICLAGVGGDGGAAESGVGAFQLVVVGVGWCSTLLIRV